MIKRLILATVFGILLGCAGSALVHSYAIHGDVQIQDGMGRDVGYKHGDHCIDMRTF